MDKKIIVFLISMILTVSFLESCRNAWYTDSTNNIELSAFTKELIDVYLKDSLTLVMSKTSEDEITLLCQKTDSSFIISLWQNERKLYKHYCYECFVGSVPYLGKGSYSGHSVRAFGDALDFILSIKGPAKKQGRCKAEYWEYDPVEWTICFNRDTSYCREQTILWSIDKDISLIDTLIKKYFPIRPAGQ